MRSLLSTRQLCFVCILFSSFLGVAGSGAQQNQFPPSASATPIHVDVEASRVYIKVGKTGFGHEHGVVGKLRRGYLRLSAASDAGLLEFDMASFVADTKAARRYVGLAGETDPGTARQVTDNMLGEHVLDVQHHPAARYVVKSAMPAQTQTPGRPMQYVLDGDFSLHGVTRPMQLTAEVQAGEHGWRVATRFAILQSNFGITPYSKAFGAVGVEDRLEIWGDVLLTSAPAQAQKSSNPQRR